ncbi:hypothetical protein NPIL_348731 [Nephila pilipes]|uniref:Zinc-finger CCCH domain-containing protein n=1 Tax=Nephila pilipes TaxID=299642 RepID=A0A8X6U9P5_NEPPI|nr:hypothetical protein NPIL_348731 [Nephila pilipes]
MDKQNSLIDCYFFFKKSFAKGDECPFRHCGQGHCLQVVCSFWKKAVCFRNYCRFRYPKIMLYKLQELLRLKMHPAFCFLSQNQKIIFFYYIRICPQLQFMNQPGKTMFDNINGENAV